MIRKSLVHTQNSPRRLIRLRLHPLAALLMALLLALSGSSALAAPIGGGQIEPHAGTWRTWLLSSGSQLRRAPPPDRRATAAEIRQLKDLAAQRDGAALDQIAFWNTGGSVYRWNEIVINQALKNNTNTPLGAGFEKTNASPYVFPILGPAQDTETQQGFLGTTEKL
jgi:hypothetical protein